jgi:hypothetical protein
MAFCIFEIDLWKSIAKDLSKREWLNGPSPTQQRVLALYCTAHDHPANFPHRLHMAQRSTPAHPQRPDPVHHPTVHAHLGNTLTGFLSVPIVVSPRSDLTTSGHAMLDRGAPKP